MERQSDENVQRFGRHDNAFGLIRLLFASLVIVSHSSALIYGDGSQEPLVRLTGTLTFGDLAVDGFFLVSGFLITGSFLKDPRPGGYLRRRAARIYPGFIVASLLCLAVVAPLGGAPWERIAADAPEAAARLLFLQPPRVPDAFAGTVFPELNGSMWTIAYEFRCYLLVLLLGAGGLLRRRRTLTLGTAILLLLLVVPPWPLFARIDAADGALYWLAGNAGTGMRLLAFFAVGALFHAWRGRLPLTGPAALAAAAGFAACLFSPRLCNAGAALFGGYLLFYAAGRGGRGIAGRINNRNDISYGVYLYAWPAGKLLRWYWPSLDPLALGAATFLLSCAAGWASWLLVEKPSLKWLQSRRTGRERRRSAEAGVGQLDQSVG